MFKDAPRSAQAAIIACWLIPGDPPGFYRVRDDEPERRVQPPDPRTPRFKQ